MLRVSHFKVASSLLTFALLVIVAGCATSSLYEEGVFRYQPTLLPGSTPFPARLAVLKYQDLRNMDDQWDHRWLALIPGILYASSYDPKPEDSKSYLFQPTEDFSKSLVEELKASNLFPAVSYGSGDSEPTGADLILEGQIHSAALGQSVFTFGFSIFFVGPIWTIGLPMERRYADIDISLSLRKRGEESPIWQERFQRRQIVIYNLYSRDTKQTSRPVPFPQGMQVINRQAIAAIEKVLREQPPSFWSLPNE